MNTPVKIEIEMPDGWEEFQLPKGLDRRLQDLLDRQDQGLVLTSAEQDEANGLVDISEWLSLLRLNARRISGAAASQR